MRSEMTRDLRLNSPLPCAPENSKKKTRETLGGVGYSQAAGCEPPFFEVRLCELRTPLSGSQSLVYSAAVPVLLPCL